MSATSASDEELSHQYRLGLVLYGGVSLAIYIYGVADEFFRAVRGRGVFSLIKALTDSDIVVDVISGTSAGGINGIFLASAICNRGEFGSFADLWREHGDIANLLRDPSREKCNSLLDSEGYYQPRLQEAFAGLQDHPIAPGRDRFPSHVEELDLFITGTDVQGTVTTHFDDAGHPLDVKDHRTVFLLKHREGRSEPFNPAFSPDERPVNEQATYSAFAKLARITSCFPAAFSPVHLSVPQEGKQIDPVDEKLRYWGDVTKEAYY